MEQEMSALEIGDYVLASKYNDGDPCDHFCVGYYAGSFDHHGQIRHLVKDRKGNSFRGNGFRRVAKISTKRGNALVSIMPIIGDKPGRSVWYWYGAPLEILHNLAEKASTI